MLRVRELRKDFVGQEGKPIHAVDGVSFEIPAGTIFTLLGPSGCGKTTTLRCIAGLERPDTGLIEIGARPVYDSSSGVCVPSNRRGIGMVFQSYAIWPHMNVFENVAFPLRVARERRLRRSEIAERVRNALDMVQLSGLERRPATKLSGGQQQRLALARALINEPSLLLLDEPLSNLDAKLRERMRFEVKRLQRKFGITTVYVTHDQAEALALSDEIAITHDGRIIQQGDPRTIYQRPNSRFVADFIGSTNFVSGIVQAQARTAERQAVETARGTLECTFADEVAAGSSALVSVRPENIRLSADAAQAAAWSGNVLTGRVVNSVFLGEVIDYVVAVGEDEIRVRTHPDVDVHAGQTVYLHLPADKCTVIAGVSGGRQPPADAETAAAVLP